MTGPDLGVYLRRIKRLREDRGLTVRDLARLAGLSPSFIRLIEAGRANPSLWSLDRLAGVFGIPVHVLLDQAGEASAAAASEGVPTRRVRLADRVVVGRGPRHVLYLVTPPGQGPLEVLVEQAVGPQEPVDWFRERSRHGGEEWHLVLRGTYEVVVSGATYELHEGDCITIDAEFGHAIRPLGDQPCAALLICTPPTL